MDLALKNLQRKKPTNQPTNQPTNLITYKFYNDKAMGNIVHFLNTKTIAAFIFHPLSCFHLMVNGHN